MNVVLLWPTFRGVQATAASNTDRSKINHSDRINWFDSSNMDTFAREPTFHLGGAGTNWYDFTKRMGNSLTHFKRLTDLRRSCRVADYSDRYVYPDYSYNDLHSHCDPECNILL